MGVHEIDILVCCRMGREERGDGEADAYEETPSATVTPEEIKRMRIRQALANRTRDRRPQGEVATPVPLREPSPLGAADPHSWSPLAMSETAAADLRSGSARLSPWARPPRRRAFRPTTPV